MKSVPSICKTSGRYHGIFLSTEPGSDGISLTPNTDPVAMAGGGNKMHRSYVCLIKGCEVIPAPMY
jgi:hypothetical protein